MRERGDRIHIEMNLGETFFLNQIFEKFLTLLSKRRAGERSVEASLTG